MDMVRAAQQHGFLIGSCSDRSLSGQRAIWEAHGIVVDFVAQKHRLDNVMATLEAERYFHIGDRDLDEQFARQAGFEFWWAHEGAEAPWLGLLNAAEGEATADAAGA
jgi:hypothetical protein